MTTTQQANQLQDRLAAARRAADTVAQQQRQNELAWFKATCDRLQWDHRHFGTLDIEDGLDLNEAVQAIKRLVARWENQP